MTGRYKAYPEYKDSGIDWFGNIPSHWRVAGFKKHIASIVDYRGKTPVKTDDGVLLVTARNIKNGKLDYSLSQEYIAPDDYDDVMSRGKPEIGHVLFTTEAPLGEVANIDRVDFALAQRVIKFDGLYNDLNNYYFKYLIMSEEFQQSLNLFASGSTVKGIKAERFVYLRNLLPSYEEQQKIASFLDHEIAKIDTLITKQEKLIELLKEKRQAVISHAVTKGLNPDVPMKDSGVEWLGDVPEHWDVASIRRFLLEHRQGYYTTESYIDDGVKLLRITDLRDLGEVSIDNCPKVPEHSSLSNYYLQEGDVVFARTGGAGSFGVIPKIRETVAYASYLIRFRFIPEHFNTDYLRFMLIADSFQLAVKSNIHGGVNQNIHAEDIKDTFVCCPPLNEQQNISEFLNDTCIKYNLLIDKAINAIELMKERKTALISAAVTGKIDVRDWQEPTYQESA